MILSGTIKQMRTIRRCAYTYDRPIGLYEIPCRCLAKNSHYIFSDSLNNRILSRIQKEFCKVLRKPGNRQDSLIDITSADMTSDECQNGASSRLHEDEVDGFSSDEGDSNEKANCFFGLEVSLDFLERCSTGEDDSEDTDTEGFATVNEQVQYETKVKRFRRLSFPFTFNVEEEIKQMYAMCMHAGKWFENAVMVRSSAAQLSWGVEFFGEYMPIDVSGSGGSIKTTLFQKLDDDIVVFGVQEDSNADIYYVSAIEKRPGALVLMQGSSPSSVDTKDFESDLRFFRKINDRKSGGTILKPAFNSNLHLAIMHNKLWLVETHANDFLHWEFQYR